MARLSQNSTPAERALGCSFAETFETSAKVVDNGGTVTGAPTIDHGATLDGSSDYITYALDGHEFNSANISIMIEFWPDFDWDEDIESFILDSTNAQRYYLYKGNNAASNALYFQSGGAGRTVTAASYSDYWLQNERNVLIIASSGGDTKAFLNGILVYSDAAAWSSTFLPTELYIGSKNSGANKFDGTIKQFKVFNQLLTAADALNYYNGTTYTYRNRAVLDLPMTMAEHDATNLRTLDVSGNGNHATFGDGSTSTTYPTKLAERGYSFDGGDYLELASANSLESADDETVLFVGGEMSSSAYIYATRDGATGGFSLFIDSNSKLATIKGDTLQSAANTTIGNGLFSGCFVRNANTQVDYYLNGIFDGSDSSLTGVYTNSTRQLIGARGDGAGGAALFITGKILGIVRFPFALSPLQVADLHHEMMKGVNHV